jgi:integrase
VTKRARGEGSIRKRPDGLWEARITLDSGKRRSFYGRTQTEDPDRQTLAEYMAVWLEDTVKPTVRISTYQLYEYIVRVHIAPSNIGRIRLVKLTPQIIQRWINEKAASGLAPQSVRAFYRTLHVALELAVRWNMIPRNPATQAAPPRAPRSDIHPLAPEQVTVLLKAAEGDRLYALYAVAVALGLRQGEILALRWQDVDLDGGVLNVANSLRWVHGQPMLLEPKTKSSARRITLPAMIITILRQHRVRQLEDRLQSQRWVDQDMVFTLKNGNPINASNVVARFKALLAKAGLPDMRFHDLRHTAASLLLAQGLPARMIMETLGHSNISITMDTYAHILPQMRREVADAMERILKG